MKNKRETFSVVSGCSAEQIFLRQNINKIRRGMERRDSKSFSLPPPHSSRGFSARYSLRGEEHKRRDARGRSSS